MAKGYIINTVITSAHVLAERKPSKKTTQALVALINAAYKHVKNNSKEVPRG